MKLVSSISEKDKNSFYLVTCCFPSEEWSASWASVHLITHTALFPLAGGKFLQINTCIFVNTAIFSSCASAGNLMNSLNEFNATKNKR